MNAPDDLMARLQANEDIIHSAGHGRIEALRRAIAAGGDVNYLRSDQGALFMTVKQRQLPCAQLLMESGANANQKNRFGWTSLHEAALQDYPEFILPLVAGGAEKETPDIHGATALLAAAGNRSAAAAEALLKVGAQVDRQDALGNSPLHAATANGDSPMVTMLLAYGANPGLKDAQGRTPLELAQDLGWTEGRILLEQAQHAFTRAQAPPSAGPSGALSRIGRRPAGA